MGIFKSTQNTIVGALSALDTTVDTINDSAQWINNHVKIALQVQQAEMSDPKILALRIKRIKAEAVQELTESLKGIPQDIIDQLD